MKLTLQERILVDELLPNEGKYANLVEVRKIRELLPFTSEEMKEFGIKGLPDGRMQWKVDHNSATYLVDIAMTEWITVTIQTKLREMELDGKLPFHFLTLYEKFIVMYQDLV